MAGEYVLDRPQLRRVEADACGARVLVEAFDAARAGDRHDVLAAMQQPGERELRGRAAACLRERGDRVHEGEVLAEVGVLEPRVLPAPVVRGERAGALDRAGEEAA